MSCRVQGWGSVGGRRMQPASLWGMRRVCSSLAVLSGLALALVVVPSSGDAQSLARRLGNPVAPASAESVRRAEPMNFARRCIVGDGESCLRMSRALARRDAARSVELLEAACESGSAAGCFELATVILTGVREQTRDRHRALPFAVAACSADHSFCDRLDAFGSARAAPRSSGSCERGDAHACLADAVAEPYRAALLNARACELDPAACGPLGDLALRAENHERARELHALACRYGDAISFSVSAGKINANANARANRASHPSERGSRPHGHEPEAPGFRCNFLSSLLAS